MPIKEVHGLAGRLHIELRDPQGRLVEQHHVNNLITLSGRQLLAGLFTGSLQTPQLKIAVGGDSTATDLNNASLGKPLDEAKASVAEISVGDYQGQPRVIARITATLPATGKADAQVLQEAGIVASLAGKPDQLYNRVVFPLINRAGNLEMTLSWEVIF